jgi:O-antigen ligase
VDDGRGLALVLLALVALSAVIALAKSVAGQRLRPGVAARRAYGGVLAGIATVGLVVVLIHFGGPVTMAEDAYTAFKDENPAPAARGPAGDLNRRLFTLRSNGRIDYWQASWDQNQGRPLLGQGAGSFEQYWLRERPFPSQIRDAHGLYAEALGEIGWIGLCLLVLALGLPLLAGLRARGDPLVPGAFGALTAYIAHAGVDWDWEVPAVTLVAFSSAAVLLICARARQPRRLTIGRPGRIAMVVALAAVTAFSVVGLVGNRALGNAEDAADAARWDEAAREARTATDWAPWSGQAWRDLARAQLGLGQVREARANLGKAIHKDPTDWRAWYYLGSASRGSERRRAYREAARLDPFAADIAPLRKRYHLPKAPEPRR